MSGTSGSASSIIDSQVSDAFIALSGDLIKRSHEDLFRKWFHLQSLFNVGINTHRVHDEEWIALFMECRTSSQELRKFSDEALILRYEHFVKVLGKERADSLRALQERWPDRVVTASGDLLWVRYERLTRGGSWQIVIDAVNSPSALASLRDKDFPAAWSGRRVGVLISHEMILVESGGMNAVRCELAAMRQGKITEPVILVQVEQPEQQEKDNILLLAHEESGTYLYVPCSDNMSRHDRLPIVGVVVGVVEKFLACYIADIPPGKSLVDEMAKELLKGSTKRDCSDVPNVCTQDSLTACMYKICAERRTSVKSEFQKLQTILAGSSGPREEKAEFRRLRGLAEQALQNAEPLMLLKTWSLIDMAKTEAERLLEKDKKLKR